MKTLQLIKLYQKFTQDEKNANNSIEYNGLFKCDDDILPNSIFIHKFIENLHKQIEKQQPIQYAGFQIIIKENNSVFNIKTNKTDLIPKCTYCTGPIYYLAPHSINILCKIIDDSSLLLHEAEDIMIGYNLEKQGIVATHAHLYKDDIQLFPYFNIQNIDQRHKFEIGRAHV